MVDVMQECQEKGTSSTQQVGARYLCLQFRDARLSRNGTLLDRRSTSSTSTSPTNRNARSTGSVVRPKFTNGPVPTSEASEYLGRRKHKHFVLRPSDAMGCRASIKRLGFLWRPMTLKPTSRPEIACFAVPLCAASRPD